MSIASTTRKAGPYTGNGVTTIFPFSFKVFASSDLVVTQTDLSGVETTLTLTTNYTVSLNANQDANPGGTVTCVSAPISGYLLTLTSGVPELQPVVLTNNGGFYPSVINDALDRLTIFAQQISEQMSRSLKFPKSDPLSVTPYLPSVSARANKYLAFDSSGNPTVSANDIQYYSDLATASANSSAASATSSAASATSSAAFATSATSSASSASASASQVIATAVSVTPSTTNFSGDGVTTTFTLAYSVADKNLIDVFISGVYQSKSKFTVSAGTSLTFVSAPASGTNNIEVKTAANMAYAVPSSFDYGLITSSATSFADYGSIV